MITLDTLKETLLDYCIDDLLDLYADIQEDLLYLDVKADFTSTQFIDTILSSVSFFKVSGEIDGYGSE
jgi:hypothetical protein